MMTRQEANYAILNKIAEAVKDHKDWRFHQILQNIGVEINGYDQFHEESTDTLKNIESSEKMLSNIDSFISKEFKSR